MPSPEMKLPDVALMAPTDYRLWIPFTVKVSISYRRWLKELSKAAEEGLDAVARCLDSVRVESDRICDDLPPPVPMAGEGVTDQRLNSIR